MKKIIVSIAVALVVFAGRTYAENADPSIPNSVTEDFSQHFARASDITWEIGQSYYKATFDIDGKRLFAFYAGNGNLLGVAHNLSPVDLPASLSKEIKDSYSGYWITGLVAYHNNKERAFAVTLESSDKIVVLNATGQSSWTVCKTIAKG